MAPALTHKQIVLVLCGLIGSGKSTFAKALERYVPEFKRCNQDDLGDRRKVEAATRRYLSQGYSVCIDRTNFNGSQRAFWIRIASEFPSVAVYCFHLQVPKEQCAIRLAKRTDHPTITSLALGLEVLDRIEPEFTAPSFEEGFEKIYRTVQTLPEYSEDQVKTILEAIASSPGPQFRDNSSRFFLDSSRGDRANFLSVSQVAP